MGGVPAAEPRAGELCARLPEALTDPQLATRGFLHTHRDATGVPGDVTVPVAAFRFAHGGAQVMSPPPRMGADTDAVLAELGYDAAAIAKLRAAAVI